MRQIALIAMMSAFLCGCQGFLGVDYDTKHYLVGSAHEVRGQYLAGIAQNDGKYEIVIGKRADGAMQAWVERDGKFVNRAVEPRRFFPNPYWPLSKPVAMKRGTPQELGLLDVQGSPKGKKWLLTVDEGQRVVGMYTAAVAMWGEDKVKLAYNPKHYWSYWVELTLDGKTYYDPCRGVYRYHYQGYNPHGKGYVEQWRGSLEQYHALADSHKRTPQEIAKNRADAAASLEVLSRWYWHKKPVMLSKLTHDKEK